MAVILGRKKRGWEFPRGLCLPSCSSKSAAPLSLLRDPSMASPARLLQFIVFTTAQSSHLVSRRCIEPPTGLVTHSHANSPSSEASAPVEELLLRSRRFENDRWYGRQRVATQRDGGFPGGYCLG